MSGYVYILKCHNTGLIKLGKSRQPQRRFKNLSKESDQTQRPTIVAAFDVVALFRYDKYNLYNGVEKQLHRMFKHSRVIGEWFKLTDVQLETALFYCQTAQDHSHL